MALAQWYLLPIPFLFILICIPGNMRTDSTVEACSHLPTYHVIDSDQSARWLSLCRAMLNLQHFLFVCFFFLANYRL